MAVQRISLNPDPPIAGADVEICHDFTGSDVEQTDLVVTFGPRDTPGGEHQVSKESPCVTVKVPAAATSITVEDLLGPSPDKWAPVE